MPRTVSALRSGRADTDTIEHGTIVTFTSDTPDIGGRDILLVQGPSGRPLNFVTCGKRPEGGTYAMVRLQPTMTFKVWLERVEGASWRVQFEPHHVEFLRRVSALAS